MEVQHKYYPVEGHCYKDAACKQRKYQAATYEEHRSSCVVFVAGHYGRSINGIVFQCD